MRGLRTGVLRLLTAPGIALLWRPWTRGAIPILMLHRFIPAGHPGPGIPVDVLDRQLSALRRRGVRILPLAHALDLLETGAPVQNAVVLTVDDGYADFHDLALPVFAAFDCPVTVFLTSGFLDKRTRLWWDTVRLALSRSGRESEADSRIEALKRMGEAERIGAVAALARESGVRDDEPALGPYAPMTWDMVRAAAQRGVTFGPHTVTHPILSRVDAAQSKFEIEESWRRLRQETEAAVPVFCYPNGDAGDQGEREYALVAMAGFRAALSTIPGFASKDSVRSATGRFALPRFAHPRDVPRLLQVTSGLEEIKKRIRHKAGLG